MAWTEITREQYNRRHLRYASDCTDEEWGLIEPFMPAPSKVGRSRKWSMRSIWDAIQYIAADCQPKREDHGKWGSRGFDARKKVKGHKHHLLTDTEGNLLGAVTHTADIQDRDGVIKAIADTKESFSTLSPLFADGGYAGEKLKTAMQDMDGPTIKIVKRLDGAKGFVVIARQWVGERTFAWLGRCRRLAKDWEATIASADA